jgi:hypothetical protein
MQMEEKHSPIPPAEPASLPAAEGEAPSPVDLQCRRIADSLPSAAWLIASVTICERLFYYAFVAPFRMDCHQLNMDITNLHNLRELCPKLNNGSTAPRCFRPRTIQSISLGQYLSDRQLCDPNGSRYPGGRVSGQVLDSAIVPDVLTHPRSASY